MIHFACVEETGRSQFMRALYDIALEYLTEDHTLVARAAAVFCLYMLYSTQPSVFKKVPIRLTISKAQNIDLMYKMAFAYSATDLIFIIHAMREVREAFVFVAENEKVHKRLMNDNESIRTRLERTLIHTERAITAKSLVPVEPLLYDLSKLAFDYHQAKSDLVSLGLSRKSSVLVMRELKKQIRPGMNLMKASPIPEFLKENDPTTIDSNRATGERSRVGGGGNPEGDAESDMMEIDSTAPAAASCKENSRADADANADPGPESISEPNEEEVPQESIIEPRANYPIPRIFNLSMLQASVSDFPVRIEDMLRQFGKDRMRRFEFTASGELAHHMYRFPQQESIVAKRKRLHDGLDKIQRRALKRKLKTALKRLSQKHKRALADKGKGKKVDGEAQGQSEETEDGADLTGEPAQGHSSGREAHAGAAEDQDQTP
ncbi:hypothetical protein KVV02_002106 [Mortierella alpina]|uniref:Uncharacterized protein n=1 Tax=Mortierella alpina TaxID=64518 RepID=A0A9P8A2U2_MORAP|nr:hypothetical protein KVV02_002106 [Mortierella alpina]